MYVAIDVYNTYFNFYSAGSINCVARFICWVNSRMHVASQAYFAYEQIEHMYGCC